jgi:hypothetical protein
MCQKVKKEIVKKLSKSCQKSCQKVVKKLSRIGCESKIVDHVLFLNKVWGGWVGRVGWEGKKWFKKDLPKCLYCAFGRHLTVM